MLSAVALCSLTSAMAFAPAPLGMNRMPLAQLHRKATLASFAMTEGKESANFFSLPFGRGGAPQKEEAADEEQMVRPGIDSHDAQPA